MQRLFCKLAFWMVAVAAAVVSVRAEAAEAAEPAVPPEDSLSESVSMAERFWVRTDYLMWWTNGAYLPPLVTTSPDGTPRSEAGVLGEPGTRVVFGDSMVGDAMRSGIRTRGGMRLGCGDTWALEGEYFTLFDQSAEYDSGPRSDRRILSRPFYDIELGRERAELVSYDDYLDGRVTVDFHDYFQSAGVWARYNLACCAAPVCDPCQVRSRRVQLVAGYRYFNLSDTTIIREDLLGGPDSLEPGTRFQIDDSFHARNDFHGAELGLVTQWIRGRWSLELLSKVALGNNHQVVFIDGSQTISRVGLPAERYDEGIFAGWPNINRYTRDSFTMIPQLGVELGYDWNRRLRTTLGYNILYWASVTRSGDQIELVLDPRNFPPNTPSGLPFPQFPGRTSDFWAQGLNLGLELAF